MLRPKNIESGRVLFKFLNIKNALDWVWLEFCLLVWIFDFLDHVVQEAPAGVAVHTSEESVGIITRIGRCVFKWTV